MKKLLYAALFLLVLSWLMFPHIAKADIPGTCTITGARQTQKAVNNCSTGYVPVADTSNFFSPTCVCKPNGSPNAFTGTSVVTQNPVPQITPPPPPCASTIGTGGCGSVNTAFGVWSTAPAGFVKSLFSILLGLSGGIAVLMIMFGGYRMIMSQGDPEKIQGAREQITSTIIGILFLIFSLVILEVIGVDILHLPGFNH